MCGVVECDKLWHVILQNSVYMAGNQEWLLLFGFWRDLRHHTPQYCGILPLLLPKITCQSVVCFQHIDWSGPSDMLYLKVQ